MEEDGVWREQGGWREGRWWREEGREREERGERVSQVSSGLLQTAQTWANAGVCGGLCACAVGGTFD